MSNYLIHYGVLGQKWGVRNYQNADGSYKSGAEGRYAQSRSGNSSGNHAFSVKATVNKALAKVYDINTKAYKNSNKALSSMNATARTQALKKADAAQNAADNKKKARIEKKRDIELAKDDKFGSKVISEREKNRSILESKYDKKIVKAENRGDMDKANALVSKKKESLSDFDKGTEAVSKALKEGKDTISNYYNLKASSITDGSVKNSSAYKEAGKAYTNQVLTDALSGQSYRVLFNAVGYAAEDLSKNK